MSPRVRADGRSPARSAGTAVNCFAEAYADLTERDYADLLAAVDDGRIEAVRDM